MEKQRSGNRGAKQNFPNKPALFKIMKKSTTGQLVESQAVQIQAGPVWLDGILCLPNKTKGVVIFVDGSASPDYLAVAIALQEAGLGTLLFNLLTAEESEVDQHRHHMRSDIGLLARRAIGAADWLSQQPAVRGLKIGFFGSSTGAPAALIVAAERPELAAAVVSCSGLPALSANALARVDAPTLLIAGQLNGRKNEAEQKDISRFDKISQNELPDVSSDSQIGEEPESQEEEVARLAVSWFCHFLGNDRKTRNKG